MDLSITGGGSIRGKSPEGDAETPSGIHTAKPFSSANGVLKRHHFPHVCTNTAPAAVAYRDCLKNHAASIGGYAVDGCGEFMPSPTATSDPTSLKCAACGCHRNFHRRDTEEATSHLLLEYQPHHRHHPPPPPPLRGRSPDSLSPPPLSSSPYQPGGAPQMLLALTASRADNSPSMNMTVGGSGGVNGRKRFRTKFSQLQKERMLQFAERVGWKMQRRDEETVAQFCREIGVERGVLKVWMHNNKNTLGKRELCHDGGRSSYAGMHTSVDVVGDEDDDHHRLNGVQHTQHQGDRTATADDTAAVTFNGSSSS